MEELIPLLPKIIELGGLGLCCLFLISLIWKGVPALNNLANSISKLADKIDAISTRMNNVEHDLRDIKNTLETLIRRIDGLVVNKNK